MSLSVRTRNVIIGVCVAVVALFFAGYLIGHRKGINALQPTVHALNTEIERVTVELNNTKLYVTSIEQEITTLRQAKADGDLTAKELRKLNLSQVNELTRLTFIIDTLLNDVDNGGTVVVIHDTVGNTPQNAIKLPFTFDKADKWLSLKGNFNSQGKLDISLKMDAAIGVYTGIDSKTKLPIARLTSDNPYFNVLSVSSIKMDVVKQKKWGVGVQVGYGLEISNPPKLSPYIGIGLSRNLIRF
jgi:hypothetical protein